MRYDVIVVGAGPAGSTTARECADHGLSVLLLDKAEFPRDKPCAGAVSIRASKQLPFDMTPVVERVAYDLYFTARQKNGFARHSSEELAYLTQRCHLDTFLAERAVEAGATFRQRAPIKEVEPNGSGFVVRTASESFEGSTLAAADGANGQTARQAGVAVALVHGIALEGNLTPPGGVPSEWASSLGFDLGGSPGGYGWIFPKGDHLNIGIGGWKYIGPSLRARLDELVRFYGYDPADLSGVRGHHLPVRASNSPLSSGNLVLVGDAAGLLDPLTGEGIYAAIWSGRIAAQHLAAFIGGEVPDLDGYQREVERDLGLELMVSRRFHDLLNLIPGSLLGVERRTSVLGGLICRLLRGEQTYVDVMRNHPKLATIVDFVTDLIRVTPYLQRISGLREPAPPERFFQRSAQHQ